MPVDPFLEFARSNPKVAAAVAQGAVAAMGAATYYPYKLLHNTLVGGFQKYWPVAKPVLKAAYNAYQSQKTLTGIPRTNV